MAEPMIYSYTTFEDAQAARAALIAGGLSAELQVIADEAGTVEGNFLVGWPRCPHRPRIGCAAVRREFRRHPRPAPADGGAERLPLQVALLALIAWSTARPRSSRQRGA